MKKILAILCGFAFMFFALAMGSTPEPLPEGQKKYLDSCPLIIMCNMTELDCKINSEETTERGVTFYSVDVTVTGQVTEILKANKDVPSSVKVSMPYIYHKRYREVFEKRPTEGKEKIDPPTEEVMICVESYEVGSDGVLHIQEYNPFFPPWSWDKIRAYLKEKAQSGR